MEWQQNRSAFIQDNNIRQRMDTKTGNIKDFSVMMAFLQSHKIETLEDLLKMVEVTTKRRSDNIHNQREIVVLEGSKDGVLYVNILIKLYLKLLQHNGKLLLNEMTPLSVEMIALLTRHEIGTVKRAIRAFLQLGLVEVLEDNTYYMPEIQEMTGKGSFDAERKVRYRRLRAEYMDMIEHLSAYMASTGTDI